MFYLLASWRVDTTADGKKRLSQSTIINANADNYEELFTNVNVFKLIK
jgi:hypothetical protein